MTTSAKSALAPSSNRRPQVFQRSAVLFGCHAHMALVAGDRKHISSLSQRLHRRLESAGLQVLRCTVQRYTNEVHHGYTFAALLTESHFFATPVKTRRRAKSRHLDAYVAGDTWPELSSVYLNVAVCDVSDEQNRRKILPGIRALRHFFKAERIEIGRESSFYLDHPPKRRKKRPVGKKTKKRRTRR